MSSFFFVVLAAALADNIVLTKMLGLCPFIGLSKRLDVAAGVGLATTAVLTVACAVAWWIDYFLPLPFTALRPLIFIAVVASAVQATEMLLRLAFPLIHRMLGVFLPLIATNCAVLGIILITLQQEDIKFSYAVASGLGGGIGFCIAVIAFALLRQRIVETQVPPAFRGAPLAVISAGIMALAVSAFSGAF